MPDLVKLKLNSASGSTEVFINPASVLSVAASTDATQSILLLGSDKAYVVEGKPADIAKLLSY
jgi:hypothetical protein